MLLLALLLQAAPDSAAMAVAIRARVATDSTLTAVYAARDWRPYWFDGQTPTRAAGALGSELADAWRRGLDPSDYPAWHGGATAGATAGVANRANAEVWLSRSGARLADDVARGRWPPSAADSEVHVLPRPAFEVAPILDRLAAGADVAVVLDSLEPRDPAFRRLEAAIVPLSRLIDDGIGFDPVLLPAVLRPGERSAAVPSLRRFLGAIGDLEPTAVAPSDSLGYLPDLVPAVVRFQERHGLVPDSLIGPATRAALAVPLTQRLEQVRLALERWRWFGDPGSRAVLDVDVAAARLAYRDSVTVAPRFEAAVIVGRPDWATPILEAPIARIVVHPGWVVPTSIALGELREDFRRDSTLFARDGYELIRRGEVVPPTDSNLAAVGHGVILRQRPGPRNALGRLKLEVEGTTAIHLHDTPDRRLFGASDRFLSHGCVRVQRIPALVRLLLDGDPAWPPARIDSVLADTATVKIPLRRPVRLRLIYATAAVDVDGLLRFRPDRYRRDPPLAAALSGPEHR